VAMRARINEIVERVLDGDHHIHHSLASLCHRVASAVSGEDDRLKRNVFAPARASLRRSHALVADDDDCPISPIAARETESSFASIEFVCRPRPIPC
jgi:hypothetical protein